MAVVEVCIVSGADWWVADWWVADWFVVVVAVLAVVYLVQQNISFK